MGKLFLKAYLPLYLPKTMFLTHHIPRTNILTLPHFYSYFRCNPDDPNAAKGYRPRVNRAAIQKLLGGAKTGILNTANQAEDDLSKRLANTNVSGGAGPSGQ